MKTNKVNIWAAAAAILLDRGADTAEEVTSQIMQSGITTLGLKGKTPEASVRSILSTAKYPGRTGRVFTSATDHGYPIVRLYSVSAPDVARSHPDVVAATALLAEYHGKREQSQPATEIIGDIEKTTSMLRKHLDHIDEQLEILRVRLNAEQLARA